MQPAYPCYLPINQLFKSVSNIILAPHDNVMIPQNFHCSLVIVILCQILSAAHKKSTKPKKVI